MTRTHWKNLVFGCLVLAGFLCSLCLPSLSQNIASPTQAAVSTISPKADQALQFAVAGEQQYRNQEYSKAALSWQQAAEAYKTAGDEAGVQKSLINQSQALQDLGLYPKACRTLLQAFDADVLDCETNNIDSLVSELSSHRPSLTLTQSIGLRSFGDVLRRQGMLSPSKQVLELSLAIAKGSPEERATLVSLGNTERATGKLTRNRWDYEKVTDIINRQSSDLALQSDQLALNAYQQAGSFDSTDIAQLQAQLNQLSLWIDLLEWWDDQTHQRVESWQRVNQIKFVQRAENFTKDLQVAMTEQTASLPQQIEAELRDLPPTRAKALAELNFAISLTRLQTMQMNIQNFVPSHSQQLGKSASSQYIYTLLQSALSQAQTLKDPRVETYALGYLGRFYLDQEQLDTATQLTKKALVIAQQNLNDEARDVTYLWQAQLGRLLDEQGDDQGALIAYTNAYHSLQALRTDLNVSNQDVQFDFRQEVKPVYLALADLLLQPKSKDSGEEQKAQRRTDLDSFFPTSQNDQGRLEMARQVMESLQLAELDNFFQDPCSEVPAIPVTIDDIDSQAAVIYPIVLRDRLDLILSISNQPLTQISVPVAKNEVDQALDQLYDLLNNESIDTSAINIFRTVPLKTQEIQTNLEQLLPIFSKIYDWLVQPIETQLSENQVKTLVFVLNDRLQRIPMAALYDGQQYLIEKYGVALAPGLQLINPDHSKERNPRVLAAGVSQQTQVNGTTFPALINVPDELTQIKQVFPHSKQLLDADFTEQSLKNSLPNNYSIVHLATHGLFSSNPDKNFIVTGDNQSISVNDLSTLLRGQRTNAPELLVLSACDTATGDEQAVLGLAGMAVRSGVSSTLATLWPVSDASTTTFMKQFYQVLSQPESRKTDAVQSAQQFLLKTLKSSSSASTNSKEMPPHPYYWAPYVLVGSWL